MNINLREKHVIRKLSLGYSYHARCLLALFSLHFSLLFSTKESLAENGQDMKYKSLFHITVCNNLIFLMIFRSAFLPMVKLAQVKHLQ